MLSKFKIMSCSDTDFTPRFRQYRVNGAQNCAQLSIVRLQEVYEAEILRLRGENNFIKLQHNSVVLRLNAAQAKLQQAEILQLKQKAAKVTNVYNTTKDFWALTKSGRRIKQLVVESVQGLEEFKPIEVC